MAGFPLEAPTCIEFARAEQIDPVGSAGSYPAVAVVEIPQPWPQDIGDHPLVAPAAAALAATNVRIQAVVPARDSTAERRRVAVYRRPSGAFRRYSLYEAGFAEPQLPDALSELASASAEEIRAPDGRLVASAAAAAAAPDRPSEATEVLVCSHGKRDACCGTLGTRLVVSLEAGSAAGALTNGSGGVRLWRTSHTGGHRFAPTALVLPQGTSWAYLDDQLLAGIVDRSLDPDMAAGHYRGCTGLDHPALQACEREAFREVGWSWFDHHRSGEVLAEEPDRTRVRLDHTSPDGDQGTFEATVEVTRRLPVPVCRQPITQSRKDAPELAVTSFAEGTARPQ